MINVTKHVQVPEHRILTESEKKALFDKYNTVKETQVSVLYTCIPLVYCPYKSPVTLLNLLYYCTMYNS